MRAETKKLEVEANVLEEALGLAREVAALRDRLCNVQREYNELLAQREAASREGCDLSRQIRPLFLEIEELPGKILPLEQRIDWLVNQEVEKKTSKNLQAAARQYMASRDTCGRRWSVFVRSGFQFKRLLRRGRP